MSDKGLIEVKNPSQYFIDDSLKDTYGRAITCIEEGSRSLFVEVQSLVVENKYGNARRTTQGFDNNRLAMLIAIVEKYLGIPLGFNDIYLNIVGGMKLSGRESDLAIIASLISSYSGKKLPDGTVFIGEVGLTGEVRHVPRIESRLKEIKQMNYSKVITSQKNALEFKGKFPFEIIGISKAKDLTGLI
jgi:DNA repair protein RadA/Sms